MAKPLLSFTPDALLNFQWDTSGYYANLYVSNTSSHPVAFKVKTTNPERYLVRPNQGVLGAHTENLEVRVVVMGEPLDALLKEVESHAGEDYFPADKFLVQYISLTPAEFDSFNNEDPAMLQTRLSSLWVEPEYKPRIVNHRMKCVYKWYANEPEASPVNTSTTEELLSSAVGEVPSDSPGKDDVIATPAATMPHEFATARPPVERRNNAGSLFSSTAPGQPPLTAVPIISTPTSEDALTFEQLKELRDKYNTLMNVSMRMTAQKEELSAALQDKTALADALQEEVRQLKSQLEASATVTGLRKRQPEKPESVADEGSSKDKGQQAQVVAEKSGGIPIYIALILAAIMFLIGRLL